MCALKTSRELPRALRARVVDALIEDLLRPAHERGAVARLRTELGHVDVSSDSATTSDRVTALQRLDAYAAALAEAPCGGDGVPSRLAQAVVLFRHALYFEVHELLEPAWRDATGDDRTLLQGIIQAAVSWHHASGGRASPALRSGASALAKLGAAPASWSGFPIARLRAALRAQQELVRAGERPPPPALG